MTAMSTGLLFYIIIYMNKSMHYECVHVWAIWGTKNLSDNPILASPSLSFICLTLNCHVSLEAGLLEAPYDRSA